MFSENPKQLFTRSRIPIISAVVVILMTFVFAQVYAATITVTPASPQGWASAGNSGGGSSAITTTAPRSGAGSTELTGDRTRWIKAVDPLAPAKLGDLYDVTDFAYDWMVAVDSTSSLGANYTPALRLHVYDPNAANPYSELIWEGAYNGPVTVTQGTWVSTDMVGGSQLLWRWVTGVGVTLDGGGAQVNQTLGAWQNASWYSTDAVVFGISVGVGSSVGAGYHAFTDNVVLGFNSAPDTYNFEPTPQCTTVCYADVVNGNDANGGTSTSDAKKTIQAAVNQVTATGQVIVAPGVYIENVTIPKSLTLSGAGQTDDAAGTVLDGSTLSGIGIYVNDNVTDVTIEDLRIEDYVGSGIWANLTNNDFTVQQVTVDTTNTSALHGGGIYMNGPVDTVLFDQVTSKNNKGRGIVIWNGLKTNITITNNTVTGNNCCGIELQDGTASGVTVTGNTSSNNGDSGMAFIGLTSGAGPNLIANNTVADNGRFGMEIKLPNGTGLTTGDGSIVVENNTVSLTGTPADLRDWAGIGVFRRGYVVGNNNVDIPTGVVVRNNTVSGYLQTNALSNSTGFGIAVEGTNMTVTGNTLNNNDVGAQSQAGHLPYTANTAVDGDQSNLADLYFGRGNSPVGCIDVRSNTFSGNGQDWRTVLTGGVQGGGYVTNVDTGEVFCTIQSAIDDSDTVNGHTLEVSAGTFPENVIVNKSLTINGANAGISPNDPVTPLNANPARNAAESEVPTTGGGIAFSVTVPNVTIDGFKFTNSAVGSTANIQSPIIGAGAAFGGDAPGVKVLNNRFVNTSRVLVFFNGPTLMAGGTIDNNRAENPTRADGGICGSPPATATGTCGYQLFNPWRTDDVSFQHNVAFAPVGNRDRVRTINVSWSTDVVISYNTLRYTCIYTCISIPLDASPVTVTYNDAVTDAGQVLALHPTWTTGTVTAHHNKMTSTGDFPISIDNTTADLDNVHITRNAISGAGNARNGKDDLTIPGTETLDVTCNWWGSDAGPNPANFYGPNDYSNWLFTANLDGPCGAYPPSNVCATADMAYLLTDPLGIGQGSPTKGLKTRKLTVPNLPNVASLYGQLAAVDRGQMKYVRFLPQGYPKIQIAPPTSPAYQTYAVSWWGTNLPTDAAWIKGQFFWGKNGNKSPRAFILWPTYNTVDPYVNVFETFNDSSTYDVFWDTAHGWIPVQTQTLEMPATQLDGATVNVTVAVIDVNGDGRTVELTVQVGAQSETRIISTYNQGASLNLEDFSFSNVEAGVDEVIITLESPNLTGDSAAMIGASANYECVEVGP